MTLSNAPTPAGWYPDPQVPGGQRWWDGQAWTEHAAGPAAPLKAPDGTKTDTVWIWLVVLLPLLSIASLFLLNGAMDDYMRQLAADPTSTSAILSLYTSPGYLTIMLGSFVLYALTVTFGALDMRELSRRQVPKPFHWAWGFFGPLVYTIGRSVVVRRRTGGGLGPLWGMIAVYVASIIVSIVWTILLMQQLFSYLPTLTSTVH